MGVTPPGSPRGPSPADGFNSGRPRSRSAASEKAEEVAQGAFKGGPSSEGTTDIRATPQFGMGDHVKGLYASLDAIGISREDLPGLGEKIDQAHATVASAPLSAKMQSLLNNIHTALKKLWSAGIAPLLAAIATSGYKVAEAIGTTLFYTFILTVAACFKIYFLIAEKLGDTDAAESQKTLALHFNEMTLGVLLAFDPQGIKGDYDYFKNILNGMSPQEALQTLQELKNNLGFALLETYQLPVTQEFYTRMQPPPTF